MGAFAPRPVRFFRSSGSQQSQISASAFQVIATPAQQAAEKVELYGQVVGKREGWSVMAHEKGRQSDE